MKVNGQYYDAFNNGKVSGGNSWTIKWWKSNPGFDKDNDFQEALITVDTDDPETAIKAAIERNSWA